jgi:hypothetical protein
MTDGLFHPEEWEDAAFLDLGETAELFLKEQGGHVFVGVHCGDLGKPFTMDLYLAGSDGEIHQLHASAQIGERTLTPGEEDPPWIWGYSPDWYANEVRWNQPMAQSLIEEGETRTEAQRAALFEYHGFEFQLRREKFQGNEWFLRVEIRSYPDFDSPLIHPEGTSRDDTDGWLRLALPHDRPPDARGFGQSPEVLPPWPTVTPPQGPVMSVDGSLGAEEWQGAWKRSLTGGGEVRMMMRGRRLSVGIQGTDYGLAHLVLAAGDTAWVLHSSAALGSAVYTRGTEGWVKVKDPTWELRDPTMTPGAIQARESYLEANGWVGSTGRMGREPEREFLLRPEAFGGGPLRLAVVFLPRSPQAQPLRWPDSASDDVVLRELLTGPFPLTLQLDPSTWALVSLPVQEGPGI